MKTIGGSTLVTALANTPDALATPEYVPLVRTHSLGASESIWTNELSLML
jgi:hypothetical protein